MKRLHRIVALVLAALWLPAVVHCAVEALELAAASEDRCCSHENSPAEPAGGACVTDPCGVFDEGHFRGGDDGAAFEAAARLIVIGLVPWIDPAEATLSARARAGRPPDAAAWAGEWVFERRAAPWANAPGVSVG